MLRKLFCVVMFLIALLIAILGISLSRTALGPVVRITNFFDIMIPVLAVAALINYLWKSCGSCCKED